MTVYTWTTGRNPHLPDPDPCSRIGCPGHARVNLVLTLPKSTSYRERVCPMHASDEAMAPHPTGTTLTVEWSS